MEAAQGVVAAVDLGAAEPVTQGTGYFDAGDLAGFGGNLYLFADGLEIGSLFFSTENGRLRVQLGQFDPSDDEWVARNPISVLNQPSSIRSVTVGE